MVLLLITGLTLAGLMAKTIGLVPSATSPWRRHSHIFVIIWLTVSPDIIAAYCSSQVHPDCANSRLVYPADELATLWRARGSGVVALDLLCSAAAQGDEQLTERCLSKAGV